MRPALITLTLAALLIGCNGGESTDTTVPDESAPDTTPSTSVATSTSTTTSTTPTTSVAPTSTVPIDEVLEAAIQEFHSAYWMCIQSPTTCDPASFLAKQGTARAGLRSSLDSLISREMYIAPDLRGTYLRPQTVTLESPVQAVVMSCFHDAGTILGPPGPDGQPTVVNDEILSYNIQHTLFLEDGRWLVGVETRLNEIGEGDQCPE